MNNKEKGGKNGARVAPVCVEVCAETEKSDDIIMEERVSTPFHRRVQNAAQSALAGENIAVTISEILGPHASKAWNLPVGSQKNPFWRLTKRVSSPKEMKIMLSKSLIVSCTLGSSKLVKNLLVAGADPNHDSGKWGPMHSAAYAGNAEIMRVLLEDPRTEPNTPERKGKTALHIAAMKGNCEVMKVLLDGSELDINATDESGCTALHIAGTSSLLGDIPLERFLLCISMLMDRSDLKINKPDKDGLTALSHIMMLNRKAIVHYMLMHKNGHLLNVDSFLAGYYGRSIREAIQHSFTELIPDLPPPFQEKSDCPNAASRLLASLQKGDFVTFQSILKKHSVDINHWYDEPYHSTITEIACQLNNRQEYVTELLRVGANPNSLNPITFQSLLHLVAKRGNLAVLKLLIKSEDIDINIKDSYGRTPLHCLSGVHCKTSLESNNLQKSIGLLLGDDNMLGNFKNADLHAVTSVGETPLHIAARMGDKETVLTLLQHGADIMYKVTGLEPPLTYIDPSVMERFLDECIESNDESPLQHDYMITIDYNFLSPIKERKVEEKKKPLCDHEMPPLKFISSKERFKYLLRHPVIYNFLALKWHKIKVMCYTNFIFYSFFLASLTWYSFEKEYEPSIFGNATQNKTEHLIKDKLEGKIYQTHNTYMAAYTCLSIFLSLLIVREIYQFFMSPKSYITHSGNWLLWIIILSTMSVCAERSATLFSECTAIALLLAWTQFVLLVGEIPALSIHIEMLKTVAWTFLTFIICYSPLFFAFSISFYTMFRGSNSDNFFSANLGMSMLKVFVMFAGEFEASEIDFGVAPYASHIIFSLFVFLVSIVLLNLLNGLAVSDAQEIAKNAEILSLSARVRLISYMEKMSPGKVKFFSVLENLPDRKFTVFPNRKKGKVELNGLSFKNTVLDEKILNQVNFVLSKRNENLQDNDKGVSNEANGDLQEMNKVEKYQRDVSKKFDEMKRQLDHLDKTNKDIQSKLNEILKVLKLHGSSYPGS